MFKQFINHVQGADLYMSVSLLIFFVFFVLVGIYILILDKKHIKELSEMPLKN